MCACGMLVSVCVCVCAPRSPPGANHSFSHPTNPPLPRPPCTQTWDDAQQSAWDSWMGARAYAGGSWADAQRAADHYWKESKGE